MADKRIGVFVCRCGGNISDYIDVDKVVKGIAKEKGVVVARVNTFSCSDAAQEEMIKYIREYNLNGIVIASCSPKLHLSTFRSMAKRGGLNPYEYSHANIREQCSWTHTHDKDGATQKAIRLVRAGIASTRFSKPMEPIEIKTRPAVLIIGAGIAGMRAAISLGQMGLNVYVVEKENEPGGLIRNRKRLFPNNTDAKKLIESLRLRANAIDTLHIYYGARLIEKKGSVGDFTIKVEVKRPETDDRDVIELNVGAIIVATGAAPYTPKEGELGFGAPFVITLGQYLDLLEKNVGTHKSALMLNGKKIKKICYIYCVGSRENSKKEDALTYCSRYCCTAGIHAAVSTHENFGEKIVQYHLYRDIRTYGAFEALYQRALETGSIFIKFSPSSPPEVIIDREVGINRVKVKDLLTRKQELEIDCDLVVLVTGMVPRDNPELESILKLPIGKDGFYNEIHPKLRPVETVVDGLFIAGCSQSPKNASESVQSALAAAAKAGSMLLKEKVYLEPFIAKVYEELCDGCGLCIDACPYEAISINDVDGKKVAKVNPGLCKGEGACVPVCPKEAVEIKGYEHQRIRAMIEALTGEIRP
ncbi:CoB--CoM heterodisulfide reductase subunit A [Dissulfuribacter thermophilus]|uniref:CoB--CoM heterodisulfide reductase subunit A n=1 Tax=Dissulfuribacter thermophilus TaxID=1156395 RepID=A0A1B9F5V2_9BACT|nr:FAD-dependent oxidoreductase [Dissulfuribacter thermophilus]OCC15185.1 CoB--CoM heterodisulfide reductase subunit A [Dissulfuribacter thermophilus]